MAVRIGHRRVFVGMPPGGALRDHFHVTADDRRHPARRNPQNHARDVGDNPHRHGRRLAGVSSAPPTARPLHHDIDHSDVCRAVKGQVRPGKPFEVPLQLVEVRHGGRRVARHCDRHGGRPGIGDRPTANDIRHRELDRHAPYVRAAHAAVQSAGVRFSSSHVRICQTASSPMRSAASMLSTRHSFRSATASSTLVRSSHITRSTSRPLSR